MLGQRRRRWTNIKPTLGEHLVSTWYPLKSGRFDILLVLVKCRLEPCTKLAKCIGCAPCGENWVAVIHSSSVSVYYVAVRTIVLSRHGSSLARPVIIHDIIHGLIYVPSTPCFGFFGVLLDGNCAYVH